MTISTESGRCHPVDVMSGICQTPRLWPMVRVPRPAAFEIGVRSDATQDGLLLAYDWNAVSTAHSSETCPRPIAEAEYQSRPDGFRAVLANSVLQTSQSVLLVWTGASPPDALTFFGPDGKPEERGLRAVGIEIPSNRKLPGRTRSIAVMAAVRDRHTRVRHVSSLVWQAADALECLRDDGLRATLARVVLERPEVRDTAFLGFVTAEVASEVNLDSLESEDRSLIYRLRGDGSKIRRVCVAGGLSADAVAGERLPQMSVVKLNRCRRHDSMACSSLPYDGAGFYPGLVRGDERLRACGRAEAADARLEAVGLTREPSMAIGAWK